MALQIRRGTDAQRQALSGVNVPLVGEPLYTTDTKKLFIGDGVTAGGTSLGYYSNVAVSGQATLSATNNTETLTLIAGNNVVLATDGPNDSVTISVATTLNELNNGNIRIINNNINGLVGNENINIDPSGTGKVVVNSAVNSLGVETNSLQVGTFDAAPTNYYFEVEGPANSRVFRAGGPGGIASAEFSAYYSTPANGQKGVELISRQSTLDGLNSVVSSIYSVVTDITAGSLDSKIDFQVRSNNAYVVGGHVDGSGFVGNLTGNVTGNLSGDVSGNVTGNVNGSVVGDLKGSVFADSSAVLVDGVTGVLRGELRGFLNTGDLLVNSNTISSINSGDNIELVPATGGVVSTPAILRAQRLELLFDFNNSGISIANTVNTNSSLVISTTHDAASTSTNVPSGEFSPFGPITGSTVNFLRARGSNPLIPEPAQFNDEIATLNYTGLTGLAGLRSAAKLTVAIDSTVTDGIAPAGRFEFIAADISGSSAVRMTVSSKAVTGTVPFKLPIYADPTTRDAAITSPDSGMIILLTDSTGTGGPAKYQGFIAGTGWVDLN
jgi:hypothetical protein